MSAGAHLRIGSHVEVQRLDSQKLEYGRVADVYDATPGTQPIVKLVSGTVGAVRLPHRLRFCAVCAEFWPGALHTWTPTRHLRSSPLNSSYATVSHSVEITLECTAKHLRCP